MPVNVFCLLWVPFFYLFWRSITDSSGAAGGVWALIAGSISAVVQVILGVSSSAPGNFGFAMWLDGCKEIILPVVIPFLVYLLLFNFRMISGNINFANFALLWLIPASMARAVILSSSSNPISLVLVPVLWTAISVAAQFLITMILSSRPRIIALLSLALIVVPISAASSYWAFCAQKSLSGYLFLAPALIPMVISLGINFTQEE